MLSRERDGFQLVHDQDVDLPQKLDRQRPNRRCVENDLRAGAMRTGYQQCIGLLGHLVLQDQDGAGREHAVRHCFRIGERVRAGGDRDAVLTVGVDQNRCGARLRGGALDAI